MAINRNPRQFPIMSVLPTFGAATAARVPISWNGEILGYRIQLTKHPSVSAWTTVALTWLWYPDNLSTVGHTIEGLGSDTGINKTSVTVPALGTTTGEIVWIEISTRASGAHFLPTGEIEATVTLNGTANGATDLAEIWMLAQD